MVERTNINKNEIIKFLSKHITLSEDLKIAIIESSMVRSFKKGTILLREGEISNECYFVFKGCVRSFILKEGEEKTIEFYVEEQPISPFNYGQRTPSKHYLECLENSILSVGTPNMEVEMFKKHPELETISRVMSELMMSKYQESLADYIVSSPEERYLNLINTRADLLQRVPQYQIASYLGIKPESLSRIRKRITQKHKK